MKKIFKYTLKLMDYQLINLPEDFQILDVQIQNEEICLWAMVDESKIMKEFRFTVIGTGHQILNEDDLKYVSTVQMGHFVWHVFINKIKEGKASGS